MHIMGDRRSRREFLSGLLAGAGVLALGESGLATARWALGTAGAAEPPPETTTIRIAYNNPQVPIPQFATCTSAVPLAAAEFLREEGFEDVLLVDSKDIIEQWQNVATGKADVGATYSAFLILHHVDKGTPVTLLGGGHAGCFELFAASPVRAIRDLKGKTIAISMVGSVEHIYLSSILTYIGLDPLKDVNWVTYPARVSMQLLGEGKIDAFMAFPPISQEVRKKRAGRVLLNSMMDRPWSQYFCCMPAANSDFVRKYPVATKRWLRAYLRAADFVVRQPERVARFLLNKGYVMSYAYALQALREMVHYGWRDYDPEDSVRFWALRLREAGMIKSMPQKIIAQGTDWRFLNEIKREWKRSQQPLAMTPDPHAGHRVR